MRISQPLARRIDRLARRAHRFHRYAHHPLCDAYAGELIALGRKPRVCRGCASALVGACAGGVLGVALPLGRLPPGAVIAVAAAIAITATAAVLLALGADGAGVVRPSKLATRLWPAAGWSFAASAAFALPLAHGAALFALDLACFAAAHVAYRRRGPERSACARCPERDLPVCSGFAPIVRRERALQRLASAWIARERA